MITCKFESGHAASLRHVTVGAIAVNDKKEVLLVKRAVQHNFGKYTVPGGFLDRDENTQQATLRELSEETGYTGEIVTLFRINDNPNRPKEDRQNVDFLYIVKITGGKAKSLKSTFNAPTKNVSVYNETSEIKWFSYEQLPSDEDFAFDHRETILLYFQYLEKPFPLPIV